jgi:galactose mutarotase-like enzyme
MSDRQSDWVSLSSGSLTAAVDPLGAQLSSLSDGGNNLLWNGDPAVWSGRAPLLFPIVGALAGGSYRLGPNTYRLPRHGFARGRRFELLDSAAASARFRLRSDDATLQVYPFRFELDVSFTLDDTRLTIEALVRNAGHEDMPASFGFHPAFRWPLPFGGPRDSHVIEFAEEEPAPVRRLDGGGLLTPVRHPTPVSRRRLVLADALFDQDVIIFDALQSRSVTYGADRGPRIRVEFPDAPYLGVWSKPRAGFICIEPWHGVADPEGFGADFTVKPGVFILAPGTCLPIRMTVALLSPA